MRLPRNAQQWIPGYFEWLIRSRNQAKHDGPVDILLCIADHFEPERGAPGAGVERRRVAHWTTRLPVVAGSVTDYDGCHPRHTFFYPQEAYRPEHLDALAGLCRQGFGEVEVHLHHDNDTSDQLRLKLKEFITSLSERHGLLGTHTSGRTAYGFIHGNWALDNARPDGRWCGVNDEITVLLETGCYADFTMPAAPEIAQTHMVNGIYYAIDDPIRPKSHDRGILARVGQAPPPDGLLMIQGILGFDWVRRKWQVLPGLENSAVDGSNRPGLGRFRRWVEAGVGVIGRPEWVFIKLHTHGAAEENASVLLGDGMIEFHKAIGQAFNDRERYRLHYVTAREMANIAKAAEAGEQGDPGRFRDYWIQPPQAAR